MVSLLYGFTCGFVTWGRPFNVCPEIYHLGYHRRRFSVFKVTNFVARLLLVVLGATIRFRMSL
jgi:hypothetical protein